MHETERLLIKIKASRQLILALALAHLLALYALVISGYGKTVAGPVVSVLIIISLVYYLYQCRRSRTLVISPGGECTIMDSDDQVSDTWLSSETYSSNLLCILVLKDEISGKARYQLIMGDAVDSNVSNKLKMLMKTSLFSVDQK